MKLLLADHKQFGEMTQAIPLRMAFCKKVDEETVVQTHYPIVCRDFFGELLLAHEYKNQYEIYGFYSNKTTASFDFNNPILSLEFPSEEVKQNFLDNYQHICHTVEQVTNTQPSRIEDTDQPNTILIYFDAFWVTKIFLISTYTFLLKACCYKYEKVTTWIKELKKTHWLDKPDFPTPEAEYASSLAKNWDFFVQCLRPLAESSPLISGWTFENTPSQTYTIHHSSGLTSIVNKNFKDNHFCVKFNELLSANKKPVS